MMANFNDAIVKTLICEGGSKFTIVADDKGGATKFGISQKAYPSLDIKNLTEKQARDIYKQNYWDRVRGDDIKSQVIANNIFDTAVNMGVRTAIRLVQIALDSQNIDGIAGNETIAAINDVNEEAFIAYFTLAKIARYAKICNDDKTQGKFLLGWVNRALGGAI